MLIKITYSASLIEGYLNWLFLPANCKNGKKILLLFLQWNSVLDILLQISIFLFGESAYIQFVTKLLSSLTALFVTFGFLSGLSAFFFILIRLFP